MSPKVPLTVFLFARKGNIDSAEKWVLEYKITPGLGVAVNVRSCLSPRAGASSLAWLGEEAAVQSGETAQNHPPGQEQLPKEWFSLHRAGSGQRVLSVTSAAGWHTIFHLP